MTARHLKPGSPLPTDFGEFQVHAALGQGSMARVYRARHPACEGDIALKVCRDDSERCRRSLYSEYLILLRLHRLDVPRVLQWGEIDGRSFLALEFVNGVTLRDEITTVTGGGRGFLLPEFGSAGVGRQWYFRAAARLVLRLARSLHRLHELGVVHRDVKPENVILRTGSGQPCLLDFGLAQTPEVPTVTCVGDVVGTLGYMSPEHLLGGRVPIDRRADVYALGVILYELLTLQLPIDGIPPDVLRRTCFCPPLPPSHLTARAPRELDALCLAALQKDPQARPGSACELAAALRDFLCGGGACWRCCPADRRRAARSPNRPQRHIPTAN